MGEFILPVQRASSTEKWYKLVDNEQLSDGLVTGEIKLRVEFDYNL
jgi:hypothetical protein